MKLTRLTRRDYKFRVADRVNLFKMKHRDFRLFEIFLIFNRLGIAPFTLADSLIITIRLGVKCIHSRKPRGIRYNIFACRVAKYHLAINGKAAEARRNICIHNGRELNLNKKIDFTAITLKLISVKICVERSAQIFKITACGNRAAADKLTVYKKAEECVGAYADFKLFNGFICLYAFFKFRDKIVCFIFLKRGADGFLRVGIFLFIKPYPIF